MSGPQVAYPWWGESGRPRRRYLLDWGDFLIAYGAVVRRFSDAMQAEHDTAQRIEARSDETPQEVRPEGREPDGEADAPNPSHQESTPNDHK